VDEERRRKERAARAEDRDPEAFLREALAHRRTGHLEAARTALVRAVELAPDHAPAQALLLLTEVALGRRTRGSFGEARLHGLDLGKLLDAASFRAVARSALDPAHGPVDAEAIEALVELGKEGALAVLDELAATDAVLAHDRLRIAVGLRARTIARWGIVPGEVSAPLREAVKWGARGGDPDWLLLAGAIHAREHREAIESVLESGELPAARRAAAVALELLGDPASRPALERARAKAESRGDRLLLERALDAVGRSPPP
jgi:hypothetical protein